MEEERLRKLEITITEVKGDVTHIKERLDNGISQTLTKVFDKVTEMCPLVKENTWWVGRIKFAFIFITVVAFGGGIVGLFFYLIKKGLG